MFIDNLALTEAFLLFAAAVLTWTGVASWWWIRKNEPEKVRTAIRGGAIPVGSVGVAAMILGLWSEMVWPYPAAMGGYNILFNDMTLLFGMVMVTFAVSAYLGLQLHYVGVFAFTAGAVVILYGWTAYGMNYTKEPFDFLLLYLGFGVAGVFALPATAVLDYYLGTVSKSDSLWRSDTASSFGRRALGVRAVQKIAGEASPEPTVAALKYRMPIYVNLIVLAFPLFMALAGIAAWWFLGTTVPGHLTPGQTP
jgi:uncharacterized membrane protein